MSPAIRGCLIQTPFLKKSDGSTVMQIHPGTLGGFSDLQLVDSTRGFFHTFLHLIVNDACGDTSTIRDSYAS